MHNKCMGLYGNLAEYRLGRMSLNSKADDDYFSFKDRNKF